MKSIKVIIVGAVLFSGVALALQPAASYAQSPIDQIQDGVDSIGGNDSGNMSAGSAIMSIVNTLLFLVGAVAVVVAIFAGFKYVTSSGDAADVTSAKNTLMYALIGVAVALLAYAIVNFAIDMFDSNGNASGTGRAAGGATQNAAEDAMQSASGN